MEWITDAMKSILINMEEGAYMSKLAIKSGITYSHTVRIKNVLVDRGFLEIHVTKNTGKKGFTRTKPFALTPKGVRLQDLIIKTNRLFND